MIAAILPPDEVERLAALREYAVLDTASEDCSDELTEALALALEVPIALVSLVDAERQWFKSRHGLAVTETPRQQAFCAHAILSDTILEIPDSHADDRFADNPLVTGPPHVRFYAGMPLLTPDGHKVGTLCVIDHVPRRLSTGQRRILQILAKQVTTQLELRKHAVIRDGALQMQNDLLAKLEEAHKETRDFVQVMSHDMRAPIVNALGFADELAHGISDLQTLMDQNSDVTPAQFRAAMLQIIEDDVTAPLDFIREGVNLLNARIDAVLSMAKHGRGSLTRESCNLNKLVHDVCALHTAELTQCDGQIHVADLPVFKTDRAAVQHIAENLIGNAVKYRSEQRPPHIEISADYDGQGITLHVKDNGRGIAKWSIPRVFEMFRRAGKQDTAGSGVGLAHCQALARRLNGRIWCDSEIGEGSTFHVFLPAAGQVSESAA